MRNLIFKIVLCLSFLFLLGGKGIADTVKAADVKAALDSKSIDFGSCTNANILKTYSNDHIVNWDGKKTAVSPDYPPTFLQMNGQEGNTKVESRSSRIKSAFSFEVAGARTVSFSYRVATWGYNDDVLVFYEDDINDALFEGGADFWEKVYTEDGEKYWDLEYTDFWIDGSIDLPPTSYFHRVNVALLAPYWDPEDDAWCNPKKDEWYSYYVVPYKAWLDDFVAEESEYAVCNFLPESGMSFGGNGLDVELDTDYVDAEAQPVLKYYYTLDGTEPSAFSTPYDFATGIHIQDSCVLRVAVYEGKQLVGKDFKAEYTKRSAPEAPVCHVSAPVFEDGAINMEVTFSAKSEALALEYHYTLDGSMPTIGSASGKVVPLNSTGILKVAAFDEGMAGPVSTFYVDPCDGPSLRCMADGLESTDGIFEEVATVVFQSAEPSHALFVNEGKGVWEKYAGKISVKDTTSVRAREVPTAEITNLASGGTIPFAGEEVVVNFRKTEKCSGDWVDAQLTSRDGWNLVAVDQKLSAKHGKELAAWLRPYGFDARRRSFELVQTMRPGYAYFVFGIPVKNRPATFSTAGNAEEMVPGKAWQLLTSSASFLFHEGIYRENATSAEGFPGWSKE
ncbi:MAG: chitobiase/beta-hexosaminidase C-terminal domain-containing protein [Lentisphaeria bacterium]|nr:chitobiase/beta-hexosaminidase C-terminal domain-containing protein [Lentisphaeria bacterium]